MIDISRSPKYESTIASIRDKKLIIMQHDFFGLEKENKIKRSNVRTIFTPHQPIQNVQNFCGRENEVSRVIEYLNTPGQHALLFGDRGVGKSSLANIACDLLISRVITGKLYKKRCDSFDTFATILDKPLKDVGIDIRTLEVQKTNSKNIGSDKSFLPILPSFGSTSVSKMNGFGNSALSPSWVAEKLADLDGLLLIDEFDVLASLEDKKRVSELLKQLSDSGSKFKILIVGIAESAVDLTAGHPSVQRCLKETRITRMSDEELEAIVKSGAEKLKLKFTESAIKRIVRVSSGYPHFTHLLCLKSAEDAIIEDRREINVKDVVKATRRAIDDSEGSLKQAYDNAVRSANTDEYKKILLAAACCNEEEIKARDLRLKYNEIYGSTVTQGHLNNHLKRLVSEDNQNILRRITKGMYRFTDPRMPSFIKIAQSFIESD